MGFGTADTRHRAGHGAALPAGPKLIRSVEERKLCAIRGEADAAGLVVAFRLGEVDRRCLVGEDAAREAKLIAGDPMSLAIASNQEPVARGGRLRNQGVAHRRSPDDLMETGNRGEEDRDHHE